MTIALPRKSFDLIPLSWEDLRLVLSIARSQSLSGAATELGLNVSTCSRRLTQVEAALNVVCFIRRPSGVALTSAGRIVFAHAEEMERQALAMRMAIAATSTENATVTIACTDSLAAALVIPALRSFLAARPSLSVNLMTGNHTVDLYRGDADLALRLRRPDDGGLRIRKIATIGYGLFASRSYVDEHDLPARLADLAKHHVIGIKTSYPHHAPAVWWEEQCHTARVTVRADGTYDRLHCAVAGLGITMLPISVGTRNGLERVLANDALPSLEVFQLAQPGALRIPQVRDVTDQIASYARKNAALIL